jgi:HSP20 family molecular chaperone IbpA
MSRVSLFTSPFLLGFDAFEERIDRLSKSTESYPPYNIERIVRDDGAETFVISIAVAGFPPEGLEVVYEDQQLIVRGRQLDDHSRQYLHRGIATRQFQRNFLVADGMHVEGAELKDGMLLITVQKPLARKEPRQIEIRSGV